MFKLLSQMFLVVSLLGISNALVADDKKTNTEKIAEGGQLYDKWWQEYNLREPDTTHPAYPSAGKKSGAGTWRCKECHGWDYRGSQGAYSSGSHFSGITGIRDYAGKPTGKIVSILKDSRHRYDSVMLDSALELLALFVSQGQVDTTVFVDDKTKKAKGDTGIGKHVYADNCVRCHGSDGNDINFGDSDKPEFIGTVASRNPWEAIHKIHNGHPDTTMPHMRDELTEEGITHLLTYIQTLPTK